MAVAIISKDLDFASVVAEHAARELALNVQIFDALDKIKTMETQLIIAHEALPEKYLAPVLLIGEKPIRLQNILEKIQNQLAREEWSLECGALFSLQQKTITNGEKNISLTDKESQLLLLLLRNAGKGVARDTLLKEVWDVVTDLESHTLETHVYRLRAKLKEAGIVANIVASPGKYSLEL